MGDRAPHQVAELRVTGSERDGQFPGLSGLHEEPFFATAVRRRAYPAPPAPRPSESGRSARVRSCERAGFRSFTVSRQQRETAKPAALFGVRQPPPQNTTAPKLLNSLNQKRLHRTKLKF